jgi:peptidoglycan/LPS O-acetylase OafA/YrhL
MPWSSSSEYLWSKEPHLTSAKCSRALSDFFLSPSNLAIATEASSHPSGLESLFSQPYVYAGGGLGNIHECTLQVCLAGGTGRDSMTFASVCVPDKCDALDLAADDFVEKLHLASQSTIDRDLAHEYNILHEKIAQMNRFLGTGWICGEYKVPFNLLPFGGIYVFISIFFIALTVFATIRNQQKKSLQNITSETADQQLSTWGRLRQIIPEFNIFSNSPRIFKPRENTACFDGLRVWSILWIILGHLMAIQSSSGGGYSNPRDFLPPDGLTTKPLGQLLFASRFAVDTFLFISGYLVVHVLCIKMPLRNLDQSFGMRYILSIPKLMLFRLIRILPLYIMTLGFWTQIAPQLGSGPFWYQWDFFLAPCRSFGWTNLLFVNNFFPWDTPNVATCFYHSWYLAVDMQLFIVAPLLIFWFQRHPRAGKMATASLMILSVLTTLILSHTRNWSVNTFDGAAVARFEIEGYAKPHIRAQLYLAGMLLAMMLNESSSIHSVNMSTIVSMTSAIVILVTMTFITATGPYSRRACNFQEWPQINQCGSTWNNTQTIWYTGMSRALWALGIGLICYLCLTGCGGLVNTFLSLPFWTPFSQLSFGVYLVHPIVIFLHQFGNRQKQEFRLFTFVLDYVAVTVVSFFLALIFSLVVELPCANLARRYFQRNKSVQQNLSDCEMLIIEAKSAGKYGATAESYS